ncbi:SRPBCC family protein [Streptomyces sp. AC627_RSS907]|uniref:SRPBCC family protein n=1 Tax=Streptomyces sp. AC627_RSS907 TaxID=2823684 RepID=UPI001C232BA5|nr:SRPBCC family protein [Streptomyces sp. AC627_RSS907]
MTPTRQESGGPSPLGDLKDALGGYVTATGQSLVGKAGERIGGLTDRLTSSADGRGSKGRGGSRRPSVKATHIMETVDIGVPLRTVYDQWTRIEDFSGFTKGVRNVSPKDEITSDWIAKIGPSSRSWKATVLEQVPDERIVWTSEGAKGSTRGAVTFHELAPRLTRVVVVVEYYPAGFFEKTANLWRAQGRRLRLDVKHFARHVTLMGDEEVEGWRGEIRDGEVVRSHEEALEEENAGDEEDEYDAEEGEDDEESVGYGRDQDEDEDDEEGEHDEGDRDHRDDRDDRDHREGEEDDEDDGGPYEDDERARPYR